MVSTLIALVVPTALVLVTDAAVALVEDGGKIPSGLPLPTWPHLDLLNGPLIGGALAVAAIVLVQGAGVAESAPNLDGRSNANQDFIAQGTANVAGGRLPRHAGRRLGRARRRSTSPPVARDGGR